jgi:hypothetical protein
MTGFLEKIERENEAMVSIRVKAEVNLTVLKTYIFAGILTTHFQIRKFYGEGRKMGI